MTERELECLFWIAEGKTSEEIAVILAEELFHY
ncbi:MAG: LuxR C-terminal-related transcriptional regulator [Tannerellaceae bacterium]